MLAFLLLALSAAESSRLTTDAKGGWHLAFPGPPGHVNLVPAGYSDATRRVLLLISITSEDYSHLTSSRALFVGPDGKAESEVPLGGYLPLDGDLSPDGEVAAVLTQPFDKPNSPRASLLAFDDAGRHLWKKEVPFGAKVMVGDAWIGLFRPPPIPRAPRDPKAGPAPAPPPSSPSSFWRLDGNPLSSPPGWLVRRGTGSAVITGGKLSLLAADLAVRASTNLPFVVGVPSSATDGSLVVAADFTARSGPEDRRLLYFDDAAHKLGEATLPAAMGINAAVSPDGTAVLLAPASLVSAGRSVTDSARELALVLTDRAGKVRWRWNGARIDPEEHLADLCVSVGGKRVSARVEGGQKPRTLLFDQEGRLLYHSDGPAIRVWLDATGEWLYSLGPDGLSRQDLKRVSEPVHRK